MWKKVMNALLVTMIVVLATTIIFIGLIAALVQFLFGRRKQSSNEVEA